MDFLQKQLHGVSLFHRSTRPEVTSGRGPSRQMSMSLTNKGLLNPTGHNNCFLNSCVQVLWHVDVFRRSFRQYKGHMCVGESCIFCALQALFTQFQYSTQSALPPDDLRNALARCYQEQHRFQLGIMDDAAECFEKILEQIHFHLTGSDDLDSCSAPHCLSHQKCSLSVLEMTECLCGETSEPLAFVQFVHYISAPSLGAAAKRKKQGASYSLGDGELFGRLVRVVGGEGEWRECETCHKKSHVKKMLLNNPDLVCIGMIWDSDQPNIDDIMSVVESVGTFVRASDIFHRVMSEASSTEYCLSSMVAYYGHHYCTFCYHTVLRQWGFFDDANFRTIGSNWVDVVELCRKAHYQPLLLVYTDPFADKITMTTAPIQVTKVISGEANAKSLPTVAEEMTKTTAVTENKPLTSSGSHPQASSRAQPNSKNIPSTEGSQPPNGTKNSSKSHSDTKSVRDPGYEIDPNTFSLRHRPAPRLYPQLSQVESEGGGGVKSPVASAPPLEALSSPSRPPKTSSNFPVVFQSQNLVPNPVAAPGSVPRHAFPVLFSSSPSVAAPHPEVIRFPLFTRTHELPPSQPLKPRQQPQRGSHYSTTNAAASRYPRPTYPSQQTNAWYPNSTTHNSPWRGSGGGGGGSFPAFFQPQPNQQQTPTNFLLHSSPQSSPRSSPSLFEKKSYPSQHQMSASNTVSGPSSLPGSPAKGLTGQNQQRASSMQPQVGGATAYSAIPQLLIARPRPSPANPVPPPNQTEKTSHNRQHPSPNPPTTGRDGDSLIEFSISPSLLSPSKTNQISLAQGSTPQDSSPASSSYLSSTTESDTSREASPYGAGRSSGLTSLEEDLMQFSLTPGTLRKVQRYRGRQDLRRGSSDSLMNTLSSRSGAGTGRESKLTGSTSRAVEERVSGSTKMGFTASGVSTNTSYGGGLLVDVGDKSGKETEHVKSKDSEQAKNTEQEPSAARSRDTRLNGEGKEDTRNEKHQSEIGRENGSEPRYADPDDIQIMLKKAPVVEKLEPPVATADTTTAGKIGEGGGVGGEVEGERPGLGEDPLYAVPEQVAARLRAKKALSSTAQPSSSAHSSDIPESVRPVLQEALEAWQKAESKRDSDISIARNNYSRAATLLMKVLLDPAVDTTLKQNISLKRQQALEKCSDMERLIKQRPVYGGDGRCRQCGHLRQLNSQQMCGPCHLKDKISQT